MDPVNITHPAFAENAVERDIAVIDVGSNTVRLVHFRLEGRAIWPVFNEKVMAGLGRGLRQRGTLHPDNIDIAMRALKRFERLLDAKGVGERYAVATAAVRNASDGPEFVQRVAVETGFQLRVLSGPEEGELSALGLVTVHSVRGRLSRWAPRKLFRRAPGMLIRSAD